MFKRPRPGETEEDILRLQEEFLRNKAEKNVTPAVTVVKTGNGSSNKESTEAEANNTLQTHIDNTFEVIPTYMNIGEITEKSYDASKQIQMNFPKNAGFPQAKRREVKIKGGKGSLFAQQMKKIRADSTKMEVDEEVTAQGSSLSIQNLQIIENVQQTSRSSNLLFEKNIPKRSYILTGKERDDIHKENVEVLRKMTEKQILEEREKLLATMDPAIVAFLKSRRANKLVIKEDKMPSVSEKNKAAEDINIEEIETTAEIITHYNSNKWLHFDKIETNKLAWMKSVDIPKIKKNDQYEARFDFEGWLLPFALPNIDDKSRILYHHGNEPGRPGYTLQELFQLSRSTVNQQKILALNTIANILSLYQSGVYKDVIELPIEQIFFVIRFCLDDNTPAVLNASIKAMRNLFFYLIDEICLDNLLGFGLGYVQPILAVDLKETEDDKTVNDQQLAETNLVKCLLRTEILTRIRYIINTVKPPLETVMYCLEILMRLSRDSNYVILQVYQCENLMKSIISNFIPIITRVGKSSDPYGMPLIPALKLIRILSSRSSKFATDFVQRYQIMDSIASYLSNEEMSLNSNGLKLQIESLHLWSVFIHYGLALEYFRVLQPIMLRMLDFHVRNTSAVFSTSYVVQGHVAALLNLIANVLRKDYSCVLPYVSLLIDPALFKWTAQFGSQQEFSCGKLQIISSLLKFLTCLYKYRPANVNLPVDEIETAVQNMISSEGFQIVTSNIKYCSNLLCSYEFQKSSPNLKTLEAAIFNANDHIVPVLQTKSCIPFLCILSEFVDICECAKTRLCFLRHKGITRYLNLFQNAEKFNLNENWFTRIESQLILNILKNAVVVQKEIDTRIFYEVAVKCLCTFNSEQKQDIEFILFNIVFSPRFYPSDVLMQNLDIGEERSLLNTALININDIFETYTQTLDLKRNLYDLSTSLSIDATIGNIIPVDWIYSPIIKLYSNQQDKKVKLSEEEQTFLVTNCLRWICVYETYFPSLANIINLTDRFCRVACIFLGSDNLFLNPEVQSLLELCLRNILANGEKSINFNKPIKGLSNFQDFYTQLLEQYQGVSYGNVLFGNFILLPLAQKNDSKYRKMLWSEYAGIIQIFNVTEEQCLYPLEIFLEPPETDLSLLESYKRVLSTGCIRKQSILYKIAAHHLQYSLQNKNPKS